MTTRSQTWCDRCQVEEHIDYSHALSLEGNEGDFLRGTQKWTNGYCCGDEIEAVHDHGWVQFSVARRIPEAHYPANEKTGREALTIPEYTSIEKLIFCPRCMKDLDWRPSAAWTVTPGRSAENYSAIQAAREE